MKRRLVKRMSTQFPVIMQHIRKYYRLSQSSSIKLTDIGYILLEEFDVKYGDTIIVHTSYQNIISTDYDPLDLIFLLQRIVGSQGNIIMPSFRKSKEFKNRIPFNVAKTYGNSGLVNEIFRTECDTLRSAHPWKSCVVWGKDAEYLVKDHHLSERAFDFNSPFYKAMLLGGKHIGIGVSSGKCSFGHTVDDTNLGLFAKVYDAPLSQTIIHEDGHVTEGLYSHISTFAQSMHTVERVKPYLSKDALLDIRYKKIPFSYANLEMYYARLLSLARKGINIYGKDMS